MKKVKELIKELQQLEQNQYIKLASDEEWNTIYNDIELEKNGEHGEYVLFGLSGSEVEYMSDLIK